jgi:hypothetical protein
MPWQQQQQGWHTCSACKASGGTDAACLVLWIALLLLHLLHNLCLLLLLLQLQLQLQFATHHHLLPALQCSKPLLTRQLPMQL